MVFFCCSSCGDSLKKNQVEKHFQTACRNTQHVSCMDCQKDFWGNEYQSHIKCISEEQKYSAPGFVPKVNKGEVKQDQWIQQVHSAINKSKSNPQVKNILQSLLDFPNIPRKRQKFENFISNSLRIRDRNLCSKVWDILMSEKVSENAPKNEITEKSENPDDEAKIHEESIHDENNQSSGASNTGCEVKLSKRERKEERSKKQKKIEKKDARLDTPEENSSSLSKNKKRKHKEPDALTVTEMENNSAQPEKKKRKHEEQTDASAMDETNKKKKHKHSKEESFNLPERSETNNSQHGKDEENRMNGHAEELKESKKRKKNKKRDNDAGENTISEDFISNDGVEEYQDATDSVESKCGKKLRVNDLIVRILQKKGEMPVKKLKKKVLIEYTAEVAMLKSKEVLWAKIEKKMKKNPRILIRKDRVRLVD